MVTWTDLLRPGDALHGWLAWLWLALAVGTLAGALLSGLLWRQVTTRRRAERSAEQVRADMVPLAQAVANSGEAVVATDFMRRITWVNEAFTRMSGYSPADAVGRSPGELLQYAETDPLTVQRMRHALDQGEPFKGELLNRSRLGRPYWVDLRIQPVRDEQGAITGFISFQSDVTERRRAEAVLRESQSLLDKTGRIGGVGGWVFDLARREVQWTDQTCRMLEAEPGFQPTIQDCVSAVAPQAWLQVQQLLKQGLSGHAHWDLELPLRTRRGREIWVRAVAEIEYGDHGPERVAGALQDITQRRELQAELRRQAELLRSAFEVVDEAFALYDPDDRLVFCNERYRDLYDVSRSFIVPGARFEDIIRQGARAGQYEAAIGREEEWVQARLLAHRAGDRTLVQRLANGRILRVVDRKMPDGHTVGFRVDITELVRATEAAESADHAKSEFIATISHELRTPLQSITGFSDLGRHFAQGHEQFEPMFRDIHDAGLRMLRLVNGLLDVVKIDGSVGTLKLVRSQLWPLVADVVRELRQMADDRAVAFVLPAPDTPLVADVDPFRFQQVVRNVLSNALRFTPPGTEIVLRGRDLGVDGVELTVQDQGPGIPVDELEQIFEAFVQSSRTRDGSGGTGLGLTICRRIMGSHAGSITARNAEPRGAVFVIRLPPASPELVPHEPPPQRRLLRSSARPPALPAVAETAPAAASETESETASSPTPL